MHDDVNRSIIDRRDHGSEGGAKAKGDCIPQSDTEVANGETEGEAADTPERTP